MIRIDRFLDSRPQRSEGFSVRRGDEGFLLCDENGEPVCAMNESAEAVWELCDGETTVAEIVDAVCLACNVDRASAVQDLQAIVTELSAGGLLRHPGGGAPGEEVPR